VEQSHSVSLWVPPRYDRASRMMQVVVA
jgi:hypothetical protein